MLVLGDFNIHVDVPNGIYAVKFLDLLESLGLEQQVTEPTHIFGHRLDLVITRRTETLLGSTLYAVVATSLIILLFVVVFA